MVSFRISSASPDYVTYPPSSLIHLTPPAYSNAPHLHSFPLCLVSIPLFLIATTSTCISHPTHLPSPRHPSPSSTPPHLTPPLLSPSSTLPSPLLFLRISTYRPTTARGNGEVCGSVHNFLLQWIAAQDGRECTHKTQSAATSHCTHCWYDVFPMSNVQCVYVAPEECAVCACGTRGMCRLVRLYNCNGTQSREMGICTHCPV